MERFENKDRSVKDTFTSYGKQCTMLGPTCPPEAGLACHVTPTISESFVRGKRPNG